MEENQQFDTAFVRHAESEMNRATQQFVSRNNLIYDWEHLSKNPQYLHAVKYGFSLWDASITQLGREQCKGAKNQLAQFKPDLILVSPLNRTLQTCCEIFGTSITCPVIVQPIIAEGLRSSCDFSKGIEQKKLKYPLFDFSKVQKLGQYWMIYNDCEQNQAVYSKIISENKDKCHQDVIRIIFKDMQKTLIYESPTNLRVRTNALKTLLKEYRKTYNKIAVVSHYNIIRFILATEFNEKDEPFHCHIGNCEVRKVLVNDL